MNRMKMVLFLLTLQLILTSCTGPTTSTGDENAAQNLNPQQTDESYLLTQEVEDTLATLQWETTSYLIEIETVDTPYLGNDDTGNVFIVPVQVKNLDSIARDICLSATISVNLPSHNAEKVIWSSTYSQADLCGNIVEAKSSAVIPVEITMVRRFNRIDENSTASPQPSPREVDDLDEVTYNQFCVTITAIDGNNVNVPVWKEHPSDSCEE